MFKFIICLVHNNQVEAVVGPPTKLLQKENLTSALKEKDLTLTLTLTQFLKKTFIFLKRRKELHQ